MIVLRYGELFLKGANRPQFEAMLLDNLRQALGSIEATLDKGQGRVFVDCAAEEEPRALELLGRVFGLSSLSPATRVEPDVQALCEAAVTLSREALQERPARTFRVRTRRSDKRFPSTSVELNRLIGSAVGEDSGLAVDLDNAELEVGVEVGPRRSFVFARRIPGAGGLPVGVSGRVALLLSGGIDSPVAGHLMQKRGCRLTAVYFHSFPYTGERSRAKVVELARILTPAQGSLVLRVVPFTAVQQAVRDGAPRDHAVVLYRRSMVRIAAALAVEARCAALATGENLGQVASQTLANIACIEDAAPLPVLRPLLAFDKAEIIALARRLGSYELSIQPYEDCCSLFVPKHPATRARAHRVARMEQALELRPLEEQAAAEAEKVVL